MIDKSAAPQLVTVDGDRLIVDGSFAWGLLDKVSSALNADGQIRTIVLDSPGGHVGVGTRMAAIIKSRGLDTLTTKLCASACTMAFAAGQQRLLRKGAKLGFHAVSGESPNAIALAQTRAIDYWHSVGATEDFITRIFETPANDVWYPTPDELRRANIVTGIVKY